MTKPNAGPEPSERTDYEPDFTHPRYGVIREDNWQEYAAQGFVPVPQEHELARLFYGDDNVYTGDQYDYAEGRPLRHMPGSGIYTNQAGLDYLQGWSGGKSWSSRLLKDLEAVRQRHEGGPGAS